MRRLTRVLAVVGLVFSLLFVALAILGSRWRPLPLDMAAPAEWKADVALVPNGDPHNLRTLHAAELFRAGRAALLLFTGSGYGGDSSAYLAEVAKKAGVPTDSMILEETATSTWENMTRSRPLLAARGAKRVLIVTSRGHAHRAGIDARAVLSGFEVRVEAVEDSEDENLFDDMIELSKSIRDAALGRVAWSDL